MWYYYTRVSLAIERGCNKHFSHELNITFFSTTMNKQYSFLKKKEDLYLFCNNFSFDCWDNS
ncbi:hypothetical protein O3M35_003796 [Rhynocoris fuscipes]|uniref:Uncharacterized protein n=1 Tax=Rhynocoris fuscipes TaxID=488301 RepID=A0AAW1CN13_9HEMI